MLTLKLLLFTAILILTAYGLSTLFAHKFKKIDIKMALVYITSMALVGVLGEIFIGSIYHGLFHAQLWYYGLWPIHHGYTSKFAPVTWGIYGFYLYMLHDTLEQRNINLAKHLALIFSVETIFLEAMTNMLYIAIFQTYYFYYPLTDLWHLTTLRVIPLYFIASFTIIRAIRHFQKDPIFFIRMNLSILFVLVFLT